MCCECFYIATVTVTVNIHSIRLMHHPAASCTVGNFLIILSNQIFCCFIETFILSCTHRRNACIFVVFIAYNHFSILLIGSDLIPVILNRTEDNSICMMHTHQLHCFFLSFLLSECLSNQCSVIVLPACSLNRINQICKEAVRDTRNGYCNIS